MDKKERCVCNEIYRWKIDPAEGDYTLTLRYLKQLNLLLEELWLSTG